MRKSALLLCESVLDPLVQSFDLSQRSVQMIGLDAPRHATQQIGLRIQCDRAGDALDFQNPGDPSILFDVQFDRDKRLIDVLRNGRVGQSFGVHFLAELTPSHHEAMRKIVAVFFRTVVRAPFEGVEQDSRENLTLQAAKEELVGLDSRLGPDQSVRINVSWVIEQGGDA